MYESSVYHIRLAEALNPHPFPTPIVRELESRSFPGHTELGIYETLSYIQADLTSFLRTLQPNSEWRV
jgi:hypothetical protein